MKRLEDININNKRVIIRCDFNVPIENNTIKDDTRIVKSLDTIKYCIERADKVIILSHLGRIKSEEDKQNNSLKIVCDKLSDLLNTKAAFYNYDGDTSIIDNNKIVLFENTRFFDLDNNKESKEDRSLSEYFASFGDIFINEAFSVSSK